MSVPPPPSPSKQNDYGAAGALGNITDFPSTVDSEGLTKGLLLREKAKLVCSIWAARSHARKLARAYRHLTKRALRVGVCGAMPRSDKGAVEIWASPSKRVGKVLGVCLCGSSFACPVCSPRIASRRVSEVTAAAAAGQAKGFRLYMGTFTAPHSLGSTLSNEVVWWSDAWAYANSGRAAVPLRHGRAGYHNAAEVTHTWNAGWHFHRHLLFYYDSAPDIAGIHCRWMDTLKRHGRWSPAAEHRAFHMQACDVGIAGYIGKLALEITSGITKGSRTPLRLLVNDFEKPGSHDGRLYVEAAATLSQHKVGSVRWSRGLREKLGVNAPVDDVDAAGEDAEATDVLLGYLSSYQWRLVIAANLEEAVLVAANAGQAALNSLLVSEGVGPLESFDQEAVERSINGKPSIIDHE